MSGLKTVVHLHSGILCSREKEGIPTFGKAWVELDTVKLSEISQLVKDKYHMMSLIRGI